MTQHCSSRRKLNIVMANTTAENKQNINLENFQWMVRPCSVYEDEYSDCTSIKGRFHQYFVFGKTIDCNAWKVDYNNCVKWKEEKKIETLKEILESEEKRRTIRLEPHYKNDVWKKRVAPPSDWNKPLPAWLEEENKNTFLSFKAEEMRSNQKASDEERSLCVIS